MKKVILSFTIAAAAAASLVSCTKSELNDETVSGIRKVALNLASADPASKVTIGDKTGSAYPMAWDALGETVKVAEVVDSAKGNLVLSSSYTLDEGKAHFNFELSEKEGSDFDYYFVSPGWRLKSLNAYNSYRYLTVTLPGEQTPFAASADTAAVLLFGKSLNNPSQGGSLSVSFKSIAAYGKLNVKNLASAIGAGERVSSFEISASGKALAGEARYYYDTDGLNVTAKSSSNSVTLDLSNVSTSSDFDLWFSCFPFDLAAGDTLVFSASTDRDFYSKTVIIPSARSFTAGCVTEFSVDMSSAKAIDYSGEYVVLVKNSENSYWALSGESDGKSRLKSKNVTYDGSGSYVASDSAIFWNLEKISGSVYKLMNRGKCVASTGTDKTAVMVDTVYRLIVVKSGDCFNIASEATSSRRLQRNSTSTNEFFAFYTSSQKGDLYLVPAALDVRPVISHIADPDKIAATGATGVEVSYSIENPVVGKTVEAVSAESWVKNFDCGTSGKIIFDVEENTAEEERSSVVTVSYEGAADVTFTVSQSAAGTVTQYTAIYTPSSTAAVKTTGTAPSGSSASYSQTYSELGKATIGNSLTLTLSGYKGKTIKGITLNMKSNSSKGSGSFSATAGAATLASLDATTFSKWFDNTSYGTTYRDVHVVMANDSYVIGESETVTIKISATVNSLYCQSYSIIYE